MLNRLREHLNVAIQRIYSSLSRFPEALLFSFALVINLMILNHVSGRIDEETANLFARVGLILALGIPLGLCKTALFERFQWELRGKLITYAAYLLALVSYGGWIFTQEITVAEGSRFAAILLAGLLAFIFIPFLPRREYIERYSIYIIFRFAITYLFSLVIVGGVSLMLLMINFLFDVIVPDSIYFDIALVVAGIFAPSFFLAYVPDARQEGQMAEQMEESYIYPKILEIFLAYILTPILLAYAVILYVYMIFITATLSWPKGLVSNLILWYSLISAVAFFFSYPLRLRNRWVGTFVTFFPWLQIPLIGLMLVAVGIRIDQYGITENRYYVIVAAIWLLITFIAYGWRRWQVSPVRLMALLAALLLLSVLGPWSSAAVSIANQNERLEQILARYELISEGKLTQPNNSAQLSITEADQRELSGILNYFRDIHQDNDIRVLREGATIDQAYEWLGITNTDWSSGDYFYYQLNNGSGVNVIPISEYDWLIDFSFYYPVEGESLVKEIGDYQLQYLPQEKVLIITERASGEEIYRENVSDLAQQVAQKIRAESGTASNITPTIEQLTLETNTDQVSLRYLFTTLSGTNNQDSSKASTLDQIQFALYLRISAD